MALHARGRDGDSLPAGRFRTRDIGNASELWTVLPISRSMGSRQLRARPVVCEFVSWRLKLLRFIILSASVFSAKFGDSNPDLSPLTGQSPDAAPFSLRRQHRHSGRFRRSHLPLQATALSCTFVVRVTLILPQPRPGVVQLCGRLWGLWLQSLWSQNKFLQP